MSENNDTEELPEGTFPITLKLIQKTYQQEIMSEINDIEEIPEDTFPINLKLLMSQCIPVYFNAIT